MTRTKTRPTFEQACNQYPQRFTADHIPQWAHRQAPGGKYYAPQYASDREWYAHTKFPGEPGWIGIGTDCYTTDQSWPFGKWLDQPYNPTRPCTEVHPKYGACTFPLCHQLTRNHQNGAGMQWEVIHAR